MNNPLMDLYGIEEHLVAESWDIYDKAIRRAHQNEDWRHFDGIMAASSVEQSPNPRFVVEECGGDRRVLLTF